MPYWGLGLELQEVWNLRMGLWSSGGLKCKFGSLLLGIRYVIPHIAWVLQFAKEFCKLWCILEKRPCSLNAHNCDPVEILPCNKSKSTRIVEQNDLQEAQFCIVCWLCPVRERLQNYVVFIRSHIWRNVHQVLFLSKLWVHAFRTFPFSY
jgi:hypothetical protein